MRCIIAHRWLLLGLLVMFAGCGGGSSGGTAATTTTGSSQSSTSSSSGDTDAGGSGSGSSSSSASSSTTSGSAGCGVGQTAGETLALNATVNGVARRFAVRLPADYDAYTPSPVVVVWHGAEDTAPDDKDVEFADDFGTNVADTQGVVMIAPLGLDQGDTGKHGNSGYGWDLLADGNDMQLMVYTLQWAKANLCVDSSKVYTMGFSWGAEMAHVVACHRPDLVQAAQADSGTYDYTSAGCASGLPALRMTFDADGDPYYAIDDLMSTVQGYAALQGCSGVADSSTDSVEGQTCKTYTNCTSGKEVTYCPVSGLNHAIPSGDAWTTWNFFQRAAG